MSEEAKKMTEEIKEERLMDKEGNLTAEELENPIEVLRRINKEIDEDLSMFEVNDDE